MAGAHLSAVPEPAPVNGTLTVANEVISQIVGLTVLECYGVVGMAGTNLTQGVARLLSRERITQGVAVKRERAGLEIDLYVIVEYGLNLAEVAATLRSQVRYQVEKLTQLPVSSLQIHIQGVRRTT
ncbi:MAG: Asp23/Gls24 family envelope stress response protein [Gaiellales bacterium]